MKLQLLASAALALLAAVPGCVCEDSNLKRDLSKVRRREIPWTNSNCNLHGIWIPSGSLCILQSIDGNSISKTCDADEDYEYLFSPDPEDGTLILTRGTAKFIGFYNDAPCTFSAVSTASSTQTWVDPQDGSAFGLTIFCEKRSCDIDLLDTSWATCRSINGLPFFGGTAVARKVPQDSLNNFDVKLYCLLPGAFEVNIDDPTLEPDDIIPLSLVSLREGILFSEPGSFYYLSSTNDNEFKQSSSTFASRLNGVDTEDGSGQSLDLKCEERLCNLTLSDSSFSTCIEQAGDFLGGCAIAKDVPEDSLDDFELELFCLADGQTGIDYEGEPAAKLPGNLEFLDDGIIKRTTTGFVYFNSFYPEIEADLPAVISNGLFRGTNTQDGGEDILTLWCSNDSCEINLQTVIFSRCIALTQKFSVFNGIGIARNVPEDSLNDFEIEVYCVPDPGQTVDIDVVSPSYTIKAGMVPISPRGLVLQTESDFVFYKASPE